VPDCPASGPGALGRANCGSSGSPGIDGLSGAEAQQRRL